MLSSWAVSYTHLDVYKRQSEARVSRSVLREAGGEIPPVYSPAHLREEEEQWMVHGAAADDSQEVADEAE